MYVTFSKSGELDKNSVWAKFAYTATDGKKYNVDCYNLDVIISVGYRVKSHRGTQFRIWTMGILKEYMKKWFALDDDRLKFSVSLLFHFKNYFSSAKGKANEQCKSNKTILSNNCTSHLYDLNTFFLYKSVPEYLK